MGQEDKVIARCSVLLDHSDPAINEFQEIESVGVVPTAGICRIRLIGEIVLGSQLPDSESYGIFIT